MKKKNHAPAVRLPASKAHIWYHCGGSVKIRDTKDPLADFPVEARRGVIVHKIAANMLREEITKEKPEQLDPVEFEIFKSEESDILQSAGFYVGQVKILFEKEKARHKGARLLVEKSLKYEDKEKVIEGPPDAVILGRDRIIVIDLKSGWVEVDPAANAQLLIYCHSVALTYGLKNPSLVGVIIQPPLKQVAAAPYTFNPDFFPSLSVDAETFRVGSHCAMCDVKTACAAFASKVKKFTAPEYGDATIQRLKEYPELLDIAKAAEKFFKDIQSQARAYILAGGKIDGWALKEGNGRRTWTMEITPEKLASAFKMRTKDFVEEKLVGVKEAADKIKAAGKNPEALSSYFYVPKVRTLQKVEDENFLSGPKRGKAIGKAGDKGGG